MGGWAVQFNKHCLQGEDRGAEEREMGIKLMLASQSDVKVMNHLVSAVRNRPFAAEYPIPGLTCHVVYSTSNVELHSHEGERRERVVARGRRICERNR